jgi:spore coat protein CotH
MTAVKMFIVLLMVTLLSAAANAALIPPTHPLFEDDAVHTVNLVFEQADWWDQLVYNYETYDDPPYLEASCDLGPYTLASIGVRLKGNSSYFGYSGVKKSFKLDIDEFIGGQEIDGLDKLNLNNCFLDPSFVREKTTYELCESMGMASCRTNYAAVYINGSYWGLYLMVEQQDQEFIESRFGTGEDGNLWKGEPFGSLEYLGPSESDYYNNYELKTNETENDWSTLVDFIDSINHTPISALPDSLHNRLDVNSALAMLAIDNFVVNLDSYIGRCANFYFYHRDLDDRFVFTKWDQNEAFGLFNMWNYSATDLQQLDPFWTNPQYGENRPLAQQLWQIDSYREVYLGHMQKLMAGAAQPTTLITRMEELRDLIRPYIYDDPNMMFTTNEFEICMTSNVYATFGPPPGRLIPAVAGFINGRSAYLQNEIGIWVPITGLVINEIMARNISTVADEAGEYDDWIEISNSGSAAINLSGLGLTDHLEGIPDFTFPDVTLQPGQYLVVWADEETHQGSLHAPFKLDGDGEQVFLTDGAVIIDQVTFPDLPQDISWGRWPDGQLQWELLSVATPGAENQNPEEPENVVLYINEFMAQNNAGIQDEAGQFEDWLELYNPGPEDVELGGLFLSDDLAVSTKWALPTQTLAAGDFILIWCDNDPGDGPLHATFKLSADGEEIGLFGRLAAGNELIDSHQFGIQTANVSEGRQSDASEIWVAFAAPTPGATNNDTTSVPASGMVLRLQPNVPNPFNPRTTLRFNLPEAGSVRLEIFDARGSLVLRLLSEERAAGFHQVVWNGQNSRGLSVPSGVYFSRLSFDGEQRTDRMTLVR